MSLRKKYITELKRINMEISNKEQYGKNICESLLKLENMYDDFREQKELCFRKMFREFGINQGSKIEVNIPIQMPTSNEKSTIHRLIYGADDYVSLITYNSNGDEVELQPYFLDVNDDFDYVFEEVYHYLVKAYEEKKKPTDEFAMATYNYLDEECKFAVANNTNLEMFCRELHGHNYSVKDGLFDVNIGAFCFTICLSNDGKYFISDLFEVWDKFGNYHTDSIKALNERLH